jgi:hypothetical protein
MNLTRKYIESIGCLTETNNNLIRIIDQLERQIQANTMIDEKTNDIIKEQRVEIEQLKSDLKSNQKIIDEGTKKYNEDVDALIKFNGRLKKDADDHQKIEEINLDYYKEQKAKATKANAEKNMRLKIIQGIRKHATNKNDSRVADIIFNDYQSKLKQRRKKEKKR